MRVSTAGQSFDLQRDAIAKAGCERVYDDTRHGRVRRGPYLGPPFRCYPEAILRKIRLCGLPSPERRAASRPQQRASG
jgi:DNA invertase Pin-like site-specific DNA recombinase